MFEHGITCLPMIHAQKFLPNTPSSNGETFPTTTN